MNQIKGGKFIKIKKSDIASKNIKVTVSKKKMFICFPHNFVKQFKWSSYSVCSNCGLVREDI